MMALSTHMPYDQCDFKATKKSSLRHTVKIVHEGVLYACNQCSFTTAEKQNIKEHVERKTRSLLHLLTL